MTAGPGRLKPGIDIDQCRSGALGHLSKRLTRDAGTLSKRSGQPGGVIQHVQHHEGAGPTGPVMGGEEPARAAVARGRFPVPTQWQCLVTRALRSFFSAPILRVRDQPAASQRHRQQAAGADRRTDGLYAALLGRVLGRQGRDARGHRPHRGDQRPGRQRCGAPTPSTASSTSSPARPTRHQGPLASVVRSGSGGYEAARWGGAWGDDGNYRIYAPGHGPRQHLARGRVRAPGCRVEAADRLPQRLGGRGQAVDPVRAMPTRAARIPANNLAPKLSGANLLARWKTGFGDGSPFTLQAYVDHAQRDDVVAFRNEADTVDLQFNHEPVMPDGQRLLWGAGYRRTRDANEPSPVVVFIPGSTHPFLVQRLCAARFEPRSGDRPHAGRQG